MLDISSKHSWRNQSTPAERSWEALNIKKRTHTHTHTHTHLLRSAEEFNLIKIKPVVCAELPGITTLGPHSYESSLLLELRG